MASGTKKCLIFGGFLAVVAAIAASSLITYFIMKDSDSVDVNDAREFVQPAWGYTCEKDLCKKVVLKDTNLTSLMSLPTCRMLCGTEIGTILPKPRGFSMFSRVNTQHINIDDILFSTGSFDKFHTEWTEARNRFIAMQRKKNVLNFKMESGGKQLKIEVISESDDMDMSLGYDESYSLYIEVVDDHIEVSITSKTFFGARNALETLDQVIVYDNIRNEFLIAGYVSIIDSPKYAYRGLHLDTSRNYFPIESIKRTIDGMAMVKLNTFHWHITDSHSFPLELKSHPEFTRLGVYSREKVYTAEDIKSIVQYARARGVRVMPEFDSPAHVGEGMQHEDFIMCFNAQPWQNFCVEPPCGQFDPSKDRLYDVLEDIYREMLEYFKMPPLFDMGGDEVDLRCWNSSETLKSWMTEKGWSHEQEGFMKLWNYFQTNALARLDKVYNGMKVPIVLWDSTLTHDPYVGQYLDKDRYIIQIWDDVDDQKKFDFLSKGFRAIVTHNDVHYLDCGFPGWVTGGHNWCSPYHGWQEIYDHTMERTAGQYVSQVIGAEVALWTEQTDEQAVDSRYWPRASALAERLWTDPSTGWRAAESRMLMNRKRLVEVGGIAADRLQPEWCLQNEEDCPV